jgi:hopanoid biosynthesis associated RND transporter like protein HpnN
MTFLAEFRDRFFDALWRLVYRMPRLLVLGALLLTLVSTLAAVFFLRLDSDQDKLVSQDLPYQKQYLASLKNFGDQEYLYVVIEADGSSASRRQAERFADRMAERLKAHPELIRAIYYRITADDLGDKALYFASPEEIESLAGMAAALGPRASVWLADGRLASLFEMAAGLLGGRETPGATIDPGLFGSALEKLKSYLQQMEQALAGKKVAGPGLGLEEEGTRYFFSSNGRLLIMRLLPSKDYGTMDVIAAPLAAVRKALKETRSEFPEMQAGLTGRPALQADEMTTTNRDMTRASLIAVVVIGVLFVIVLHGWLRPLLVIASLGMAIAWTFGFTALTLGVLNLLSIVFALVLVGIGVDFGVHVVLRYVEERKEGQTVESAVRRALVQTGPGVAVGAVTSVCAFYAVLGSDFRGLAELGLVGGTGILFCLLVMLTVLPALLLMAGRKGLFPGSSPRLASLPFMEKLSDRPAVMLAVLTVITLALAPGLFRTGFSYNLLELQARGLESVDYEHRMIEASDESTWFAIATADDLEQAAQLRERILALPSVGKIESLIDLMPDRQAEKQALFAKMVTSVRPVPKRLPAVPPPDAETLAASLEKIQLALEGLEEKLFAAGAGEELAGLEEVFAAIERIRDRLGAEPLAASRLSGFQEATRETIASALRQLRRRLTAEPVSPADLPASLKDIYVGRDGRMQLKIIPRANIWEYDNLKRFVRDLRRVDPEITGVPVSVLESARLMKRTFLSAAGLTLALVSLLLWFNYRSLRQVMLTLLPLAVSLVWLLELMGWLGLDFNLANFFAVPILIAIGVDGGVHFLARGRELGSGRLFGTSTPMAVALSFTTTMIGFGGLLFAHHRGLASLGAVMVLGSLAGMLSCLLVMPAVMKLGEKKAQQEP